MMKKISAGITGLFMIVLALISCEQETTSAVPSNPKALGPCYAYQAVMGNAVIAELNALANCDPSACSGNSVTTTINSGFFVDPATSANYVLNNFATISIATQADILQQGRNFATTNFPSGYSSIGSYSFRAVYLTFPGYTDYFNIGVVVTYLKCTGGGGGGQS